jgi:hypothetical protein
MSDTVSVTLYFVNACVKPLCAHSLYFCYTLFLLKTDIFIQNSLFANHSRHVFLISKILEYLLILP